MWFDLNANGIPDLTAWTAPDHEDGLLYADWNRNRTIDGGRELFGDATILPDGRRATHGYDALAAFDEPRFGGNGDHVISRADRIWPRLRIWIDRDHDGLATQAENYTLAEIGVVELALVYVSMGANESFGADRNGNLHMLQGHFLARIRGELRTHAMHEVYFRTVPH